MNLTRESLTEMLSRRGIPGLSLAQLRDMVAHEQGHLTPSPRLRGWLRSESEGFRLFDPWLGPWKTWASHPTAPYVHRAGVDEHDEAENTWVVPRDESPGDLPPRRWERIGVAIRALGLQVDEGSPALLARWVHLVQEAEKWREPSAPPPAASMRADAPQRIDTAQRTDATRQIDATRQAA